MTTRDKLLDAAAVALAEDGVAGVSARSVAARAEVNQALVFYHFGSVADLLAAAVRRSVDTAVASYRDLFSDVASLGELLAVGRELHEAERRAGNVLQMAQVMAGALRDKRLAGAGRYAMDRWAGEVEAVLYDGVDPDAAGAALASLDAIGALVAAFDGLPPVARRAVRARARRAVARAEKARGSAS